MNETSLLLESLLIPKKQTQGEECGKPVSAKLWFLWFYNDKITLVIDENDSLKNEYDQIDLHVVRIIFNEIGSSQHTSAFHLWACHSNSSRNECFILWRSPIPKNIY